MQLLQQQQVLLQEQQQQLQQQLQLQQGQHGSAAGAADVQALVAKAPSIQALRLTAEVRHVQALADDIMQRMRQMYCADHTTGDMALGSVMQFVYRKLSVLAEAVGTSSNPTGQVLQEFLTHPACVFQKPDVLRIVLGCLPFSDLQMVLAYVMRQHSDALSVLHGETEAAEGDDAEAGEQGNSGSGGGEDEDQDDEEEEQDDAASKPELEAQEPVLSYEAAMNGYQAAKRAAIRVVRHASGRRPSDPTSQPLPQQQAPQQQQQQQQQAVDCEGLALPPDPGHSRDEVHGRRRKRRNVQQAPVECVAPAATSAVVPAPPVHALSADDASCDDSECECDDTTLAEPPPPPPQFQLCAPDVTVLHNLVADVWNRDEGAEDPSQPGHTAAITGMAPRQADTPITGSHQHLQQAGFQGQVQSSAGAAEGRGRQQGHRHELQAPSTAGGAADELQFIAQKAVDLRSVNGALCASNQPWLAPVGWWLDHLSQCAKSSKGSAHVDVTSSGHAGSSSSHQHSTPRKGGHLGGNQVQKQQALAAAAAADTAGAVVVLKWVFGKIVSVPAEEFRARQLELRGGRDRDTAVLDLYEDLAYGWRSLQGALDQRTRLEELRKDARAQFTLVKQIEEEGRHCHAGEAAEFLDVLTASHQAAAAAAGISTTTSFVSASGERDTGMLAFPRLNMCEAAVDVVRRHPYLAGEPSQRYARALLDRELAVLFLVESMLAAETDEAIHARSQAEEALRKHRAEMREVEVEHARLEAEGPASHRKRDLLDKATKEAEHRERLQDLQLRLQGLVERVATEEASRLKWAEKATEVEADLKVVREQLRQHSTRRKQLDDICSQLELAMPPGLLHQHQLQHLQAQQLAQQQAALQQAQALRDAAASTPGSVPAPPVDLALGAPAPAAALADRGGVGSTGSTVQTVVRDGWLPVEAAAGSGAAAREAIQLQEAGQHAAVPGHALQAQAGTSQQQQQQQQVHANRQSQQLQQLLQAPVMSVEEWHKQRLEVLMYRLMWVSEAVRAFQDQYDARTNSRHYQLFLKATTWAKSLADEYEQQVKGWYVELDKLRAKLLDVACVDLNYTLTQHALEVVRRRIEVAALMAREEASLTLLRELELEQAGNSQTAHKAAPGVATSSQDRQSTAANAASSASAATATVAASQSQSAAAAGGGVPGAGKNVPRKAKVLDKAAAKKERELADQKARAQAAEARKQAEEVERERLALARRAREAAIEAELERRRHELEAIEARREAEAIRAAQEASLKETAAPPSPPAATEPAAHPSKPSSHLATSTSPPDNSPSAQVQLSTHTKSKGQQQQQQQQQATSHTHANGTSMPAPPAVPCVPGTAQELSQHVSQGPAQRRNPKRGAAAAAAAATAGSGVGHGTESGSTSTAAAAVHGSKGPALDVKVAANKQAKHGSASSVKVAASQPGSGTTSITASNHQPAQHQRTPSKQQTQRGTAGLSGPSVVGPAPAATRLITPPTADPASASATATSHTTLQPGAQQPQPRNAWGNITPHATADPSASNAATASAKAEQALPANSDGAQCRVGQQSNGTTCTPSPGPSLGLGRNTALRASSLTPPALPHAGAGAGAAESSTGPLPPAWHAADAVPPAGAPPLQKQRSAALHWPPVMHSTALPAWPQAPPSSTAVPEAAVCEGHSTAASQPQAQQQMQMQQQGATSSPTLPSHPALRAQQQLSPPPQAGWISSYPPQQPSLPSQTQQANWLPPLEVLTTPMHPHWSGAGSSLTPAVTPSYAACHLHGPQLPGGPGSAVFNPFGDTPLHRALQPEGLGTVQPPHSHAPYAQHPSHASQQPVQGLDDMVGVLEQQRLDQMEPSNSTPPSGRLQGLDASRGTRVHETWGSHPLDMHSGPVSTSCPATLVPGSPSSLSSPLPGPPFPQQLSQATTSTPANNAAQHASFRYFAQPLNLPATARPAAAPGPTAQATSAALFLPLDSNPWQPAGPNHSGEQSVLGPAQGSDPSPDHILSIMAILDPDVPPDAATSCLELGTAPSTSSPSSTKAGFAPSTLTTNLPHGVPRLQGSPELPGTCQNSPKPGLLPSGRDLGKGHGAAPSPAQFGTAGAQEGRLRSAASSQVAHPHPHSVIARGSSQGGSSSSSPAMLLGPAGHAMLGRMGSLGGAGSTGLAGLPGVATTPKTPLISSGLTAHTGHSIWSNVSTPGAGLGAMSWGKVPAAAVASSAKGASLSSTASAGAEPQQLKHLSGGSLDGMCGVAGLGHRSQQQQQQRGTTSTLSSAAAPWTGSASSSMSAASSSTPSNASKASPAFTGRGGHPVHSVESSPSPALPANAAGGGGRQPCHAVGRGAKQTSVMASPGAPGSARVRTSESANAAVQLPATLLPASLEEPAVGAAGMFSPMHEIESYQNSFPAPFQHQLHAQQQQQQQQQRGTGVRTPGSTNQGGVGAAQGNTSTSPTRAAPGSARRGVAVGSLQPGLVTHTHHRTGLASFSAQDLAALGAASQQQLQHRLMLQALGSAGPSAGLAPGLPDALGWAPAVFTSNGSHLGSGAQAGAHQELQQLASLAGCVGRQGQDGWGPSPGPRRPSPAPGWPALHGPQQAGRQHQPPSMWMG